MNLWTKIIIAITLTIVINASLISVQSSSQRVDSPQKVGAIEIENCFRNADFNDGLASPSYWWTYSSGNGTVFTWQEMGGIDDSRYVRIDKSITLNSGAWAQGIETNGEVSDYRATAWVKGEFSNMGPDGGFYICVECWSKNWTYLGGLDSPHITTNVTDWTLTSIDGYLFADTYHISVTLNIRDCTGWVGWDNATFNFR